MIIKEEDRTIFRVIKDENNPFAVIHRGALQDANLTSSATGILAKCLSFPDNWKFTQHELFKHFADGQRSIKSGIKILRKFGYMYTYNLREKGRIVQWATLVFEAPKTPEQITHFINSETHGKQEIPLPHTGIPYMQNEQVVNPLVENEPHINNILINNIINKNLDSYSIGHPSLNAPSAPLSNHSSLENVSKTEIKAPRRRDNTETATKTSKSKKNGSIEEFERFWKSYPRRVKQDRAIKAFNSVIHLTTIEEMLAAIQAQAREKEAEKSYTGWTPEWPHPASWLNDKRWKDEVRCEEEIKASAPKSFKEIVESREKIEQAEIDKFFSKYDDIK